MTIQHLFCKAENDLHYLQYIPENEIGEKNIFSIVDTKNYYLALLLLGGIRDFEVLGRTVPTVHAAALLFQDGNLKIYCFLFKMDVFRYPVFS